jgi:hypothetical protein
MEIISRKEARERGLTHYYTGKPCKHGHLAERAVGNRTCAQCAIKQHQAWYVANGEKVRERNRAWREANPERCRAYYPAARDRERDIERSQAWRKANAERQREKQRAWYEANRKKARDNCRAWRKSNPGRVNALYAKRRASKIQRTPAWSDQEAIGAWYQAARILTGLLGETYHVDHIVPMQGKLVSGLHVFENLQLLPASENVSKSNRFHVG